MGRSLLLLVFVIAAFIKLAARQQPEGKPEAQKNKPTTIYLIRHAEKVTSNPQDQDPGLAEVGLKRAEDLKQFLKDVPVDAFFSTPYKRTQLTLAPLAQGQPLQFYEAHDFGNLRNRVLHDFKGKTIVIAGHSNTLLPIIEAFGGNKPVTEIADNQYNDIFKLKILPKGKVVVQAQKYGTQSF